MEIVLTDSRNSGTPASKVALQNQSPIYLPVDDHRNNAKFMELYPWVVFVNRSDPRLVDANDMDPVTRSSPAFFSEFIMGNENPSMHDFPAALSGDYDSNDEWMENNEIGRTPSDGDRGIKHSDAASEGYDPNRIANDIGSVPDNSTQSDRVAPEITRVSDSVLPPYNLSIQTDTYVIENQSLDGIPTYSVVLSFDADGYELEYIPVVVKQS